MRKANRSAVLLRALLVWLLFAGAGAPCLQAVEKHWIAHEAEVIVVGKIRSTWIYPWFDGWELLGTITVDEVLYGPTMPREIKLSVVCQWSNCDWLAFWKVPSLLPWDGIWFLKRIGGNTFRASLARFDFGFRDLSTRDYWQEYIERSKIHPWPGFGAKTSNY